MATNLKIDTALLDEALILGEFGTKKDTVNEALRTFIRQQKQRRFLELEGSLEEFDDFDHKQYRKGR